MPQPQQDKPKSKPEQDQTVRSPKPGAAAKGSSAKRTSTDIIRDEAERTKSSTSADRAKRTHKQSTARRERE